MRYLVTKYIGHSDSPELKNIYLTVAVFLWTLNGWPVNMMRFAMTRVVSGFMNVPIATSCGAVVLNRTMRSAIPLFLTVFLHLVHLMSP